MTAPDLTARGLTWDHPRGYDALAEAARRVNSGRDAPLIHWDKQPLEGFESAPIADLAARYDLLVLDHPHLGEAVAEEALIPLDALYAPEQIAVWSAGCVGPSFASYRWGGRAYALPLDVATQAMARRPDRLAAAPASWEEIAALAEAGGVAQSLAGPHAALTLFSMVAGRGGAVGGPSLLPEDLALWALETMRRLYRLRPAGSETLNPIGLLEAMAREETIRLVPLIFGYVTYARAGWAPHPIAFSDTLRAPGGRGGVLGGTGIGFSRRSAPSPELCAHIAGLLDETVQRELFPAFGGQPSARAAWRSDTVNAAWGGFYAGVLETAETALLRPRFDGFIAFQTVAAARLRDDLARAAAPRDTLAALRALWTEARAKARGALDDDRTEQT